LLLGYSRLAILLYAVYECSSFCHHLCATSVLLPLPLWLLATLLLLLLLLPCREAI
jgi:hypothetical protein